MQGLLAPQCLVRMCLALAKQLASMLLLLKRLFGTKRLCGTNSTAWCICCQDKRGSCEPVRNHFLGFMCMVFCCRVASQVQLRFVCVSRIDTWCDRVRRMFLLFFSRTGLVAANLPECQYLGMYVHRAGGRCIKLSYDQDYDQDLLSQLTSLLF